MKKIYTLAKVLILSALFCSETQAQCVTQFPIATPYINFQGTCRVVVYGMAANAPIRVINSLGQDITLAPFNSTNASGDGFVFFNCNSSAFQVTTLTINGICNAVVGSAIDLPIKLTSFTATIKGESTVQLKWGSSFEANSSQYVVEKSADGKNFSAIGSVAAAGFSNANLSYGFEDKQFSGTAFYRLKMVDIDATSEYSKVIYANGGKGGTTTLSVFPNPFKSDIQLKGVSSAEINSQNVKVYNVAGKQVGYRITGSNSIAIDASLPQGVYILRVKDQNYKLIKE